MVQFEELMLTLQALKPDIDDLSDALGMKSMKSEIEQLELKATEPGFWDNVEKSQQVLQKTGALKGKVEAYEALVSKYEDTAALIELANEEEDLSLLEEAQAEVDEVRGTLEKQRLQTLLTGEYDKNNAILTFHAGSGGTEAQDWAEMLYRMYTRWADRKGFSIDVMNFVDGDEAGIKSVDFQINGSNAYGYLKSERGVHRLVRISPFNAQGKRQTSFVSCDVMPDIEKDIDIVINPDDIRIDTYRSSGAGGQHINKTSSAIRITHFPSGIVVTCQNERSQFQNKDNAMQILKAKLYMKKMEEEQAKLAGIRGEVKDIAWGSQIRSYVLQPYTMVKDTRTGEETSNTSAVLDGDIDRFINAYLKMEAGKAERKNI